MTAVILGWNPGNSNNVNVSSNMFSTYSNPNASFSSIWDVVYSGTRWFNNYYNYSTNGTTWTSLGMSAGTYGSYAMATAIVAGQLWIVSGKSGGGFNVYVSTNEGSSWTLKTSFTTSTSTGLGNWGNRRMSILSNSDGTSLVIINPNNAQTRIAFSSDSGATWAYYSDTTAGANTKYFLLNGRLYRSLQADTTMTYTSNNGSSWTSTTDSNGGTNPGMRFTSEESFASASDTNAVMGYEGTGVVGRFTTNGGVSWSNVSGITGTGSSTPMLINQVRWLGSQYVALVACRLPSNGNVNWTDVYTSPTGATWTYQRTIGGTPGSNTNNIPGGVSRLSVNFFTTPLSTQIAAVRTTQSTTSTTITTKATTAAEKRAAKKAAEAVILDPAGTTSAATLTTQATTYTAAKTDLVTTYIDLAANLQSQKTNLESALTILGV
jgi:hypothetical protein